MFVCVWGGGGVGQNIGEQEGWEQAGPGSTQHRSAL